MADFQIYISVPLIIFHFKIHFEESLEPGKLRHFWIFFCDNIILKLFFIIFESNSFFFYIYIYIYPETYLGIKKLQLKSFVLISLNLCYLKIWLRLKIWLKIWYEKMIENMIVRTGILPSAKTVRTQNFVGSQHLNFAGINFLM